MLAQLPGSVTVHVPPAPPTQHEPVALARAAGEHIRIAMIAKAAQHHFVVAQSDTVFRQFDLHDMAGILLCRAKAQTHPRFADHVRDIICRSLSTPGNGPRKRGVICTLTDVRTAPSRSRAHHIVIVLHSRRDTQADFRNSRLQDRGAVHIIGKKGRSNGRIDVLHCVKITGAIAQIASIHLDFPGQSCANRTRWEDHGRDAMHGLVRGKVRSPVYQCPSQPARSRVECE